MNASSLIRTLVAQGGGAVPGSAAALLVVPTTAPPAEPLPAALTLYSGAAFVPTMPSVGWAAKVKVARAGGLPKFSEAQMHFVLWCYNRGVKSKGDKLSPIVAAELMRLHGTALGAARFPEDEYWTARPTPTFRAPELLDHWRIRPWFSTQKAKIQAAAKKTIEAAQARSGTADSSDDDGDLEESDEE